MQIHIQEAKRQNKHKPSVVGEGDNHFGSGIITKGFMEKLAFEMGLEGSSAVL